MRQQIKGFIRSGQAASGSLWRYGRLLKASLPALVAYLLLAACAGPTGVSVLIIQPAKEPAMSKARKLAIVNFSGDRRGTFIDRLESSIAGISIDGESYFTLVARDMLDVIVNEQRMINETGLFKQSDAVKLGGLSGADTIISGSLVRPRYETSGFKEGRSRCTYRKKDKDGNNAGCGHWYEYTVNCTTQTSYFEFNFKAIDVTRGEIIFAKNYSDYASNSYCPDSGIRYNKTDLEDSARTGAMKQLRLDIAPYNVRVYIEFMTEDKSDMPRAAEDLLESGLEFVNANRFERACELFQRGVSLFGESPALYHNLGVCAEIKRDLVRAMTLFKTADSLSTRPEGLISAALKRISTRISEQNAVEEQLR